MGQHYPAEFKAARSSWWWSMGPRPREASANLVVKLTTLLSWIKPHRRGVAPSIGR
jgi:hypothetical protein